MILIMFWFAKNVQNCVSSNRSVNKLLCQKISNEIISGLKSSNFGDQQKTTKEK